MILKMRVWLKSFKKIQKLSSQEKLVFTKVTFNLIFLWSLLKILPFSKFLRFYKIMIYKSRGVSNHSNKLIETSQSIKKVSSYFAFQSTCLIQALTAKLMLCNIPNLSIIIGVSLDNGFEAHAWIEKDRMYIIGDIPSSHFTPIWHID